MDNNRTIKNIFSKYLTYKGYVFNNKMLLDIVDSYLDCQAWDNEKMITGNTEEEMINWIKHTSEVERVLNEI